MLKLLGNRVLVKPIPTTGLQESGLFLLDKKENVQTGIVVALGPGAWVGIGKKAVFVEPQTDIGDTVFFGKYSVTMVEYEGSVHLLIDSDVVLAIKKKGTSSQNQEA